MRERASEVLEIHCLDSMEIDTPELVKQDHAEFHFHQDFNEIPGGIDIICALHPNPWCLMPFSKHGVDFEDDFQHKRYTIILAHLAQTMLKEDGQVFVQFDDEMAHEKADRFSEMLIRNSRDTLTETKTSIKGFPSDIYIFHSVRAFTKTYVVLM